MKVVFLVVLLMGVCHGENTDSTPVPSTTKEPEPTEIPTTEDPTSTPSPETTTPAPEPTTSAPEPTSSKYFVLYEDDIPCIMVTGDLRLNVQYTDANKESRKSTISVPVPSANTSDITISGVCKQDDQSRIVLSWAENNFTLTFNLTSPKTWELSDIQLEYKIDTKDMPNSPDAGSTLHVNGTLPGLSHRSVPVNQSLSCRSLVESSAFSGKVVGSNETYKITATALGYKFQAFNENPVNGTKVVLQDGLQCYQDDTSDLIPLAVGCALAGLVLIVLIAYLIGRRKRASAYQSVE